MNDAFAPTKNTTTPIPAWVRWLIVAVFVGVWVVIALSYPVYFQRDDARGLAWVQTHDFADCFSTSMNGTRSHDGRYRPLPFLAFMIMYRVFGFGSHGWHLMLGAVFILSMIFMFKLVKFLSDEPTAHLATLLWLGAFQFLLTVLFWFGDMIFVLEMLLVFSGLYFLVTGFGKSVTRLALGMLLLAASFLEKEPTLIIVPFAAATYIWTCGSERYGLTSSRRVLYAAIALLSAPVFLAIFPYALQTNAGSMHSGAAAGIVTRLQFFSKQLASGTTGLILLIPALYYSTQAAMGRQGARRFPVCLAIALVASLFILKAHLYPLGILALAVAALLLPRRYYIFVPWAFLPFLGLLAFPGMFRTYLYELSFALAALAALETRVLLADLKEWWNQRVKNPAITCTAVSLVAVAALSLASIKAGSQGPLLRRRSDSTMAVKEITPQLKRLPANSTLVVVDYNSLDWNGAKAATVSEEDKLLVQGPMLPYYNAQGWMKAIGRNDVRVIQFEEFRRRPGTVLRAGETFLWLMTPTDHKLASSLGINGPAYASARRGTVQMDLIRLTQGGKPL